MRDGKLVALASTEAKRTAIAPELPTMVEAGLPGFETGLWFGLLAPAGTPKEIIDKIARAGNEALAADEVGKALAPQGIDLVGGSPEEFARYLDGEMKRWATVAQAAGLEITMQPGPPGRRSLREEKRMDKLRRRTLALAVGLAAQFALPSAQAEDYPARPVRIIVGFIPGSSADITARVLGQRMGQTSRPAIRDREQARRRHRASLRNSSPAPLRTATRCSWDRPPTSPTPRSIPICPFDMAKDFAPDCARHDRRRHPGGASIDRREQRCRN